MKLLVPRAELKEAIAGLGKVINPRASIAILTHVRLDAHGGALSLTGTDLSKTATYSVEVSGSVTRAGSAIVPLDALQSIMKSAQGSVVEIETTGDNEVTLGCSVSGHTASRRVATPDLADWPALPSPPATNPVDARLLGHIRSAIPFASTDSSRHVLNAVFLDVRNPTCHRVVGCDSRRLTAFNSVRLPLEESVIVPIGKFLTWNKLNGEPRIGADAKREVFTLNVGPWTYTTKLTSGVYPHYEQVVPTLDGTRLLELSQEDMELLIKTLPSLPEFGNLKEAVVLRLDPQGVQVYSRDASGAESVIRLDHSQYTGPAMRIAISRHFWKDALQAGFRLWEFLSPTSPLVGRLSKEDTHSVHVLMPLRVLDSEVQEAPKAEQGEAPTQEPEPVSVPEPVHTQTTHKETPMPKKTEESHTATTETATSLDRILAAYDAAKNAVRDANNALADVAQCVRDAIKEDRARRKEIADVRAGLAKLQAIRV